MAIIRQVLLCLIICLRLGACDAYEDPIPYVAWSMDEYEGRRLIPDYNNDTRFQGDLSDVSLNPETARRTGVVGDALYISKTTFTLVEDIRSSDCIRDPDACASGGLSLTFWLRIEKWNHADIQVFFRSTTATRTLPGIYFGQGADSNLSIEFRRSSGKIYETNFVDSYAWNQWAHIGLTWNKDSEEILVYINGSLISTTTISAELESTYAGLTNFVIGSFIGPTFFLDELKIFYRTLSAVEVAIVYGIEYEEPTTTSPTTSSPVTTTFTSLIPSTSPVTITSTSSIPNTSPATTKTQTEKSLSITSTLTTAARTTISTMTDSQWETTLYILLAVLIPLLLIALCFLLVFCLRRKKRRHEHEFHTVPMVEYRDSDDIRSDHDDTDNDNHDDSDAEATKRGRLLHT